MLKSCAFFLASCLVCFFVFTTASVAAENDTIKIVPFVCSEPTLETCYTQEFTGNPFMVELIDPELRGKPYDGMPTVFTQITPYIPGSKVPPRFKWRKVPVSGRIHRVLVRGVAESAWADGFFEAYAVIPPEKHGSD